MLLWQRTLQQNWGAKIIPYTMTEYEKLANSGSWKGGYVFLPPDERVGF